MREKGRGMDGEGKWRGILRERMGKKTIKRGSEEERREIRREREREEYSRE